MHSALLIDELLRQIFQYFCESNQRILISAACSCKAWKEPALDVLWKRLPSLGPLLLLLPGISIKDKEYVCTDQPFTHDLSVFNTYACRVKHVSNRQLLKIHPNAAALLPIICSKGPSIPNLTTAHISILRCNPLAIPLNISSNLIRLDIDLGFKKQTSDIDSTLCNFLEQVISDCSQLRHISFRGLASKRLNQIVSTMRNLQSLSLRLGHTLLPETFHAIKGFPYLLELEVHAGHIELQDTRERCQYQGHEIFAMLRKLHIRAKSSTIEDILQLVQPNTLHYLHIELDDTVPSGSLWNMIFERICSKTADTLHHLALEHHFESLESPSPISSDASQNIHHGSTPSTVLMPFETFQTLHSLKSLRHFSCDLTLPPIISDRDVEKMVSWWPGLGYLELGSALQTTETESEASNSQMTVASLPLLAAKASKIERLILPLKVDEGLPVAFPLEQTTFTNQLRNLTIAQLNISNPLELANFLCRLFPSLEVLEGPCDDGQPWIDINHVLRTANRDSH